MAIEAAPEVRRASEAWDAMTCADCEKDSLVYADRMKRLEAVYDAARAWLMAGGGTAEESDALDVMVAALEDLQVLGYDSVAHLKPLAKRPRAPVSPMLPGTPLKCARCGAPEFRVSGAYCSIRCADLAEVEEERDAAKRGWDVALAATHDLALHVAEVLTAERDEARAERDHYVKAYRTEHLQWSRISGMLCDAGDVPVDPQPEAVAILIAQRDEARAEVERLRAALVKIETADTSNGRWAGVLARRALGRPRQ